MHAGRESLLILAATGRLASAFSQINSYPHLMDEIIADRPDRLTDANWHSARRVSWTKVMNETSMTSASWLLSALGTSRTTTDISDADRAVTFDVIETPLSCPALSTTKVAQWRRREPGVGQWRQGTGTGRTACRHSR
ncbi:hypothetical protein [Aquamicrobium defluvii]|uniref:baeRF11 domain-containing protein n=1 Tax=Aquamicrobium defluvii TaxID=69279 RepID=UPI002CAAB7F3|nr:hypothetical protein [Bellilinea sp.]